MANKLLAILGGGDWADASVEHLIKITEKSADDLYREYNDEGSYHGTQKWFGAWLLDKGYCREATDDELEVFSE